MRVLFLNPAACLGRDETSLVELLAGLQISQPDWDLHVLISAEGPLTQKCRAMGIAVTVLPFSDALARTGDAAIGRWKTYAALAGAAAAVRYTRELSRAIRAIQPDLVHSNGIKMHLLASAALRNRLPLIWHVHDYLGRRRAIRPVVRLCSRWCRAVIANSHSVAADLRRMKIAAEIVPIYNAVDFARFSSEGSAADLDAMCGLSKPSEGSLRIGLIATFARWKGHLTFLEAIGKLPEYPPFRAYIIGGPVYETAGSQFQMSELQEAAARCCPGRVGFTGLVEDTAEAMRALDVVVHASTRPEPFGMVIVEGMACGKAVLASGAGGSGELFETIGRRWVTTPGIVSRWHAAWFG